MSDTKVPLHKHSHPAYGWIALVFSTVVILAVAGWYVLVYQQGLNDDLVYSVQSLVESKSNSVSSTSSSTNIKSETDNIDADVNSVSADDLSDAQLDNTILGIQ